MLQHCLTYCILIGIILFCLYYSQKKEKFSDLQKIVPGTPTQVSVKQEDASTLTVEWQNGLDPISDPIKGHIVMITTTANPKDGSYLHFSVDTKCDSRCSYKIANLGLKYQTDYNVAVIAVNNSGPSEVSPAMTFKSMPPMTPAPVVTNAPTEAPLATPVPTLFGEDTIKREGNKKYIDRELEEMVKRAEEVYSIKAALNYPNTFIDDIKPSIKTLNDSVLKELQENRIGIHLNIHKN